MNDEAHWNKLLDKFPGKELLRDLEARGIVRGMTASEVRPDSDELKNTGTTILALKYADGILCAADTQVSSFGGRIFCNDFEKIYGISQTTAILGSGAVSSLQMVVKHMRAVNRAFMEQSDGYFISVNGQANYLSRLCRILLYSYGPNLFSLDSILCGLERHGEPKIFSVGMDGSIIPMQNFHPSGSGAVNVLPILKREWKEGMAIGPAVRLAVAALGESGNLDAWTSNLAVALPRVAVITAKTRFAFVREEVIADTAAEILEGKGLSKSPLWQAIERRSVAAKKKAKRDKRKKNEKKGGVQ